MINNIFEPFDSPCGCSVCHYLPFHCPNDITLKVSLVCRTHESIQNTQNWKIFCSINRDNNKTHTFTLKLIRYVHDIFVHIWHTFCDVWHVLQHDTLLINGILQWLFSWEVNILPDCKGSSTKWNYCDTVNSFF